MDAPEVLVAGAGPTGLTIACSLRLHGVPVRVIDRAPGPAVTSRANFLHARGSEVLDRLGALGALPEESLRAMRITTYLGDRPVMRLRFGDPGLRTAAPPLVTSQANVEAALRDRLAELGCTPEWNAALVDVAQDDAGVTATLSDGRTIRASWLIGCDGTSSTTRKLAGIDFPGVRLSERFLLADLRLGWDLDRGGTSGWIHPEGMLGVMPMPSPGGDLWRVIAYDPGQSDKPTDAEILARMRTILPGRTGRAVEIGEATWLSVFTVHRRLASRYRAGRILLAGDAAHAHAPFGGQGMLTGIGDAENLGWKLALVVSGQAGSQLLDTYEAERRPLATEVLRGTATVTKMNIASSPLGRFVRDRVIVPLVGRPGVQRRITYTTSQLWVSYRRGPLGGGRRFGRKPQPGDRVADLAVVRPDGTKSRLHAELGGRWAVLTPAGGGVPTAPGRLGDHVGMLHHDGDDVLLVRPDGHLAWRGSDPAGLDRWLEAAL